MIPRKIVHSRLLLGILLYLGMLLQASSAYALSAMARVSRTSATVAESLSISIEVQNTPVGITLEGPWNGTGWVAPFVLLQSLPPVQEGGLFKWQGVFAIIDTGDRVLPAFDIISVSGNDTLHAKTNPIPISIRSTIKATPGDNLDTLLQPDRAQKSIPPSLLEWFLWVGLPILIVGLSYLLYRYMKYRQSLLPPPPPPPPPSPEKVAFEKLSVIRTEAKWQLGDIKGFSTDLIETLKEYIEHRFKYNALEKTTSELSDPSVGSTLGGNEHRTFVSLLSIADEVKFARGDLAGNRCLEGIKQAEDLVGIWSIRWQQEQDRLRLEAERNQPKQTEHVVVDATPQSNTLKPLEPLKPLDKTNTNTSVFNEIMKDDSNSKEQKP
ncbi:MAG: hypothetical protein OEM52_12245 [bacterium]|nr:hypothetical protein [bacterium]